MRYMVRQLITAKCPNKALIALSTRTETRIAIRSKNRRATQRHRDSLKATI